MAMQILAVPFSTRLYEHAYRIRVKAAGDEATL
jgi:hypothetical protein